MNDIIQNMLDRHSCRSFTAQPIEQEKLDDLITAAVWAPSGMNRQTWHFTMITNTEKIQQLAATSLGLGSCWINQVRDTCDAPEVRALLTEFGVPETHIVNAAASLGYAAAPAQVHERAENTVSFVK